MDIYTLNSSDVLEAYFKPQKRHKFNAQKTLRGKILFDSKIEADYSQTLKTLELGGFISALELQPVFELQPRFQGNDGKWRRAITYRADFRFIEDGKTVVVDVKGFETETFKMKKKLFEYKFPDIELRIIKKKR